MKILGKKNKKGRGKEEKISSNTEWKALKSHLLDYKLSAASLYVGEKINSKGGEWNVRNEGYDIPL